MATPGRKDAPAALLDPACDPDTEPGAVRSRRGRGHRADGLIGEVHPAPEKAISDGAQSLDLAQFQNDEGLRRTSTVERIEKTSETSAAAVAG